MAVSAWTGVQITPFVTALDPVIPHWRRRTCPFVPAAWLVLQCVVLQARALALGGSPGL